VGVWVGFVAFVPFVLKGRRSAMGETVYGWMTLLKDGFAPTDGFHHRGTEGTENGHRE
jgi:hypothetical protein